jgi:serine protease Do
MRTLARTLVPLLLLPLPACRTDRGEVPVPQAFVAGAPSAETFQNVVDAVLPAIVFIQTEGRPHEHLERLMPGLERGEVPDVLPIGVGSGVLYSADGLILTNNHVVQQAERVSILLYDRRQFEAEVVARDPATDVAVVRIHGSGFPFVRLGDSDDVRMGDWVLALGSPLGLQFTVTAGIVSGTGRALGVLRGTSAPGMDQAPPLEHFIQTDAAINVGNSGGPLVNLAGEVVGINTAIASPTGAFAGYGFAIPSNLARHVADQLVRYGEVRRSFLGVVLDNVTPADAEVYGLERAEGAEVKIVEPGSPADRGGVELGDVIVGIEQLEVRSVADLQAALARIEPEQTARLRIVRFGEPRELQVRLGVVRSGVVPQRTAAAETPGQLGFGFAERDREIVVTHVSRFSSAGRAGLRPGQVIRSVNQQSVRSPQELDRALQTPERNAVSLIVEDPRVGRTIVNFRVEPAP